MDRMPKFLSQMHGKWQLFTSLDYAHLMAFHVWFCLSDGHSIFEATNLWEQFYEHSGTNFCMCRSENLLESSNQNTKYHNHLVGKWIFQPALISSSITSLFQTILLWVYFAPFVPTCHGQTCPLLIPPPPPMFTYIIVPI